MGIVKEFPGNHLKSVSIEGSKPIVESLAQQWAKKYIGNLKVNTERTEKLEILNLSEIVSPEGRKRTAQKVLDSLRSVSAKAWNKTEALLSTEVQKHGIDLNLINPWEIAGDSFNIYQKALDVYTQQTTSQPLSLVMKLVEEENPLYKDALEVYTEQVAPSKLATVIGAEIGKLRNKYTSHDPRVIGFVSMQFHYTSQMLLQGLEPIEQSLISTYFKVIDDHLYMPLQRAYDAAAEHESDSVALSAVQKLLPISTQIAKRICQRVIEIYPNYNSMSGRLSNPIVKTSSIRDVEMFQIYLWVCALETSCGAIQEELFPLCVMLYPRLNVQWEVIRQMLHLLRQEINNSLTSKEADTLMPYFQILWDMFSPEVFAELGL
ncbi:hypothetical protein CDG77_31495 [Nostoc sp. 'Peltigera membranacea cyanobiont' 213]|uniref:hypothetical protein n=1 Tax=unclassified Nostoc TaxID=2593658 RepID=UPI000B95C7A2|nr:MULTISPECIES: hypothetical protein [unclassified Nostoc]AVH65488.1 hypothetical protein NPM_3930 [Nostoc sp. 'Peltigera membranacea cyanobiont' N6]OYD87066.1 hypothetical protein CDG77_31495 [Nostoc sp. 'Peltigera membranacea cyanobiont' 213]